MLLLHEGLNNEQPYIISDAGNVTITDKLNDDGTLEFELPHGNKYGIDVGRKIECEGELYIVISVSDDEANADITCKCIHEFVYMAKRRHLPNIASTASGDFIGVQPYVVIEEADSIISDMGYSLATPQELAELGLSRISGVEIDFESMDKTTLWDTMLQVINCVGFGEIFFSSKLKKYGIVERIGNDTDIVISPSKNANGIKLEYDITDMITVLYPYGKDNLDISAAAQNNDGKSYIISDNISKYGRAEGFKNYDHSDPDVLFSRALWEFDELNPNRIDVPNVNISGNVAMLGITKEISLGDTVTVTDNGNLIRERIIEIRKHPFDGKAAEVSIGRPARDMFFYLRQVGVLAQRYKNVSADSGKIYGQKVTGTIKAVAQMSQGLTNDTVRINDGGLRVLSSGNTFLSATGNNFSVGEAIVVTANGNAAVSVNNITLNNYQFTTDVEGNLYFDGKRVQLIQEGE